MERERRVGERTGAGERIGGVERTGGGESGGEWLQTRDCRADCDRDCVSMCSG